MQTKRVAFATTLLLILTSSEAKAVHFNRGHFVPAYAPCAPGFANVVTSGGVAACAPATLLSDCVSSPTTSLRLNPSRGKTSFNQRPKGRRRTRINNGENDIDTRVKLVGVETCQGERFSGQLTVYFVLRMFRTDPACSTGQCTIPDFGYEHPLSCRRGRCKLIASANQELASLGIPPLPNDLAYAFQVVSMTVMDQAGGVFLTVGLQDGDPNALPLTRGMHKKNWIWMVLHRISPRSAHAYGATGQGIAKRLEARIVGAYPECEPGTEDTVTSDGIAACSAKPMSNCEDDPLHAIVPVVATVGEHIGDGRGKMRLSVRKSEFAVRSGVDGLEDCEGNEFSGSLRGSGMARITLADDAACGQSCTTIDTELFSVDIPVVAGDGSTNGSNAPLNGDALVPRSSESLNLEILNMTMRDASDNPVLIGPSIFVRCNFAGVPNFPGGPGFCFGN